MYDLFGSRDNRFVSCHPVQGHVTSVFFLRYPTRQSPPLHDNLEAREQAISRGPRLALDKASHPRRNQFEGTLELSAPERPCFTRRRTNCAFWLRVSASFRADVQTDVMIIKNVDSSLRNFHLQDKYLGLNWPVPPTDGTSFETDIHGSPYLAHVLKQSREELWSPQPTHQRHDNSSFYEGLR